MVEELHKKLVAKEISVKELFQEYLQRIKKQDKDYGSFLYLIEDEEQINYAQKLIDEKRAHLLTGIPIAVKDNILIKDYPCTAGSKILENFIAPYDATVIKKLRELGAVFIGKTNLDEFAMGSSTENSAFKKTKNPYNPEYVPGGSSGGSAVAVAKDFAPLALGSDTGGSIRQPASFCGIVGFKPTYGLVSRYGLIAMASSLDQIGPFAKTVKDAKILFESILGPDPLDATTHKNFTFKQVQPKIIGIPKEYFQEGLDERIKNLIFERIEEIKSDFQIKEVNLPMSKYALACYYLVMPAEVSANLARYDGIRYGWRKDQSSVLRLYETTRGSGFGPEVKRRIFLGTFILSHGYYDAYYVRALKLRNKIKEDFKKVFKEVDFIFTPTSPTLPFKFGEKIKDPLSMYLSDLYTVGVNLAGLPALSLNIGFIDGLPVGLQIIGDHFSDLSLLDFAEILEKKWSSS